MIEINEGTVMLIIVALIIVIDMTISTISIIHTEKTNKKQRMLEKSINMIQQTEKYEIPAHEFLFRVHNRLKNVCGDKMTDRHMVRLRNLSWDIECLDEERETK